MTNTERIIELGLSANELAVIYHLTRKGGDKPKDIASGIGVSTAAMTGLGDRLVARGLIKKVEHSTDRRAKLLMLTEAGNELSMSL